MLTIKKTTFCMLALCVMPAAVQAETLTFDFTGRLIVAGPYDDIISNYGQTYTPISASLTFNTRTGIGNSNLSISMDGSDFFNLPLEFHDISMSRISGTQLIDGQVLVDFGPTPDMPMHIEWDASGLFNAIDYGLQVGDKLSGTHLYRDFNHDGIWDASELVADIGSATPYSDILQAASPLYDPSWEQGPAPMAATMNSLGMDESTPFNGIRGLIDIGSGNSMYVTSVSTVPVPAAVWLFGSGLLGLAALAKRRKS